MTFSEWLAAQSPDVSAISLARRVIAEDEELVVPLIAQEIEHMRRHAVRTQETEGIKAMLRAMGSAGRVVVTATGGHETFAALLRERFALGDGTRVTWGQATAEQHRQRIVMLDAMRRGIENTVERHRLAIERLCETGATCLDDLAVGAAAA